MGFIDRLGQKIVFLQIENKRFGYGVEGLLETPAPSRRLRIRPSVLGADAKGSDRDVRRSERFPFRVQIDGVRNAVDSELSPEDEEGIPAVLELVAGVDKDGEPGHVIWRCWLRIFHCSELCDVRWW